ncbi:MULTISPECIES: hypothetical protein [Streptomycetaceae]|uniref:hypothetical protein n=1 Tax=Streptomycetaceae TaxID=2062 RepID=UPI000213D9D8|nr:MULTISPECIES: hypothetical protein [Streptomycetaceae]MYS58298.1 hypothetical protein [Streptomyces sp. SID5468]CCB73944.1 putative membrane protein [Streptantibioticus cattleyicolor NRRL 8057 = DSM 46488]
MGYALLYIAFGIVALWLLGEVLLQHKARLRWRLCAFAGFLGVVAGVVIPSVLVICLGAVAFATGQTFVTLSYRRGFTSGWALGGRPGASRRRRAGGRGGRGAAAVESSGTGDGGGRRGGGRRRKGGRGAAVAGAAGAAAAAATAATVEATADDPEATAVGGFEPYDGGEPDGYPADPGQPHPQPWADPSEPVGYPGYDDAYEPDVFGNTTPYPDYADQPYPPAPPADPYTPPTPPGGIWTPHPPDHPHPAEPYDPYGW